MWAWWIVACGLSLIVCCQSRLPEEDKDTVALVSYYGYPIYVVDTVTPDGYILTLHRIPFGKTAKGKANGPKPVVFLQHGFIASSADWVTNLPDQSAGFLFADAGFDVWMGNVRGNVYSNRHIRHSPANDAYWEFSWDEMAEHDLPTMVQAVLNVTEARALYYVGHSQGTEIMFAKLAAEPGFGKKISKFFALAPVASVSQIRGFLSYLGHYIGSDVDLAFRIFGAHELLPNSWLSKAFAQVICGHSFSNPLCENVLFQIGGPESNQFNKTRLMVYMKHTPAGTSTRNLVHWIQMTQTNRVQKYDYGSRSENLKHYGQDSPPIYNLTHIQTPTYLFYSPADWLADDADVTRTILGSIDPVHLKRIEPLTDFNHFDFIWGLRAKDAIYNPIIKEIRTHFLNTQTSS